MRSKLLERQKFMDWFLPVPDDGSLSKALLFHITKALTGVDTQTTLNLGKLPR